ncbi:Uncharacterized protein Fot_03703 [Forsythia ovata]|uniref:Uncharacterized protein n=1 Tax=Forsythia ovata TaxID=205694 RepID=A0ABD1XAK7_9LAMI
MHIPNKNIKQSTGAPPDREGMSTHEPRNCVKAGAEAKALTTETRVCSGRSSIAGKGYLVGKSHTIHSDISSLNNSSQLQLCNKHGGSTAVEKTNGKINWEVCFQARPGKDENHEIIVPCENDSTAEQLDANFTEAAAMSEGDS